MLITQTHKYDRDKFKELDKVDTHSYFCKDKERLSKMVKELFNETHLSEGSGNCSATLLAFNKVQDYYCFLFGNRQNHKLYCIKSKQMFNVLGQASYTSNLRLVHSKFSNLFFDGIDCLTVKKSGADIKFKV